MTRRVEAWSGDPAALTALRHAVSGSGSSGRRLLCLEVICAADHPVVDVWTTPDGAVCAFRREYDKRTTYEALWGAGSAPDLEGSARDDRHLEARFLTDLERTVAVFCSCRRDELDREWLFQKVRSRRNSTRRAGRRVVLPSKAQRTV